MRLFSNKETETRIDEIDLSSFAASRQIAQSDYTDCTKKNSDEISFPKFFKKYNLTEEDKKPFATK